MGRRGLLTVLLAGAALLITSVSAVASPVEMSFTSAPITVGGYSVERAVTGNVDRPAGAGFITQMAADVVDVNTGKQVPISRIMLHHIVFAAYGVGPGNTAFYGDGEERAIMKLPAGYGYPVAAAEKWAIVWMLMNHRQQTDAVKIRWRLTWDTDPNLKPVTPMSFDASHSAQGLVYSVAGGGKVGSTDVRTQSRVAPFSGRIVAGLGHVHGGAAELALSEPGCGNRTIYRSSPTWGTASNPFYNVKPILHEPGPINMSRIESETGIPVHAGEELKLSSVYDAHLPHTRVMGLMVVYIAKDDSVTSNCGKMPSDVTQFRTTVKGRSKAPVFRVPLTGIDAKGHAIEINRPPGSTLIAGMSAELNVGDAFYSQRNISIAQGGSVTWAFGSVLQHDVTVADGPRGFNSDWMKAGQSFTKRFDVPGKYKLFCSLHPVQMTQVVTVRPKRAG
ncbi:MAG: plastocyanin/azurin family copper-binding protein [Actinomycetes bacterium]